MSIALEPGTWAYFAVLFVGIVVAVTLVNVVALDAPVPGSVVRGIAIGVGAVVASWYFS
ncbi:hypothetical protein I7X12_01250 [Halosimplex litoreum]|uniref:Uncharacterized protein n=1 Tax=Halosimplex litoreum TaxID=1198301 RepID=A0A7T3FYW1_9EURY|nr:hypothetical protein [Halosimplex litoreum]QPV63289.1 hypothetical protein I7X12_01250 [Halosimplex litoreum]